MSKHKAIGLTWRKLDLHVHTPASVDYNGPNISADAFVAEALSKSLHGIAITDHNTAAWIDRIQDAARPTTLAVFPGVEITATGGLGGIHIIALFERNATAKEIESLLAKLKIEPQEQGKTEAISPCSPLEVVEAIYTIGGVAILAHADSSKGVLADMKGQARIRVMNSPALSAVELCNYDKNIGLLDGTDADYKRPLAAYRASDNPNDAVGSGHTIAAVGKRFSWFKMDGIELTALAQCFADPEMRIIPDCRSEKSPAKMYPRILSISVSSGFLADVACTFHEGLNSIIGGKGVGKSLIVEFLRFALDQPSAIDSIRTDMQGKLSSQLGLGGSVTVRAQLEASRTLTVTRTFDDVDNPTLIVDDSTGQEMPAHISHLFPILAYSQTEALEIARDSYAQLGLIDSLIDISALAKERAELEARLCESDRMLAESMAAEDQRLENLKDVTTLREQIERIDRALKSDKHDFIKRLEPKTQCLGGITDHVGSVHDAVNDFQESLADCSVPDLPEGQDSGLKGLHKEMVSLTSEVGKLAEKAAELLDSFSSRLEKAAAAWNKHVESEQEKYREWAAAQGGNKTQLIALRKRHEIDRGKAEKLLKNVTQKSEALKERRKHRSELVAALAKVDESLYQLRLKKYKEIESASKSRLRLDLLRHGDNSRYMSQLTALKKGSKLQDSTIKAVVEKVKPEILVDLVIRQDIKELARQSGLAIPQCEKLLQFLNSIEAFEEVLSLEHAELLTDLPLIKYKKEDGKYYELASLSIGQKCTALIIIALADGSRPVIIDQPEDSLDTPSIFFDVTLQLRANRDRRQFILTTHNSTVAVAADSDEFHVLDATAESSGLSAQGAMDRPSVRQIVIQHLEGGSTPFELKTRKYAPRIKTAT